MNRWKRPALVMIVALTLSVCLHAIALAGPFEEGQAAYDRQDYKTALKLWQPLANQGNAKAQLHIGGLYLGGQGVKQDYVTAMKWLRKAADQGNAVAQYNIGLMYQNGYGVKQDYAAAEKWFYKAAKQGHSDAQDMLGWQYTTGHGVTQDTKEGEQWFLKAANQGNWDSMVHLTELYSMGSENLEAEYFWLGILANSSKAWVKYRDQAATDLTPEQKAQLDKRIQDWKLTPAPSQQ